MEAKYQEKINNFIEAVECQVEIVKKKINIENERIKWINPTANTGRDNWACFLIPVKVDKRFLLLKYCLHSDSTFEALIKVKNGLKDDRSFTQIRGPRGGKTLCFSEDREAIPGFYMYADKI